MMTGGTEVAIVGAGPYGLSIAAYLRAQGVPFRIFGHPMQNWREGMPAGMRLKSDGFASNLYDPRKRFTLESFCGKQGIAYHATNRPVDLQTFVAYGLAFRAACVPELEDKLVTQITRDTQGHKSQGYKLNLDDGSVAYARRVVIATGISHLQYVPPELEQLGDGCSHSSGQHDLAPFAGRSVVVVGGGSSATDVAALLHKAGASVELVSRHPVEFHQGPGAGPRPLWQRIRRPHLGLGASLRSAIYTLFPGLFRLLPKRLRLRIVKRHLGPAGGWFMREEMAGIPTHEGFSIQEAREVGGQALVRFLRADGATLQRTVDHVISATGYQVNLSRLAFLDPSIREQIRLANQYPVLSHHFESSVPGLYFVGILAAGSFGPLMRFALGAGYTSRRLAAHLGKVASRSAGERAAQAVTG